MLLAPLSSLINLPFFSSRDVSVPERAAATSDIDAFSSDDVVLVDWLSYCFGVIISFIES